MLTHQPHVAPRIGTHAIHARAQPLRLLLRLRVGLLGRQSLEQCADGRLAEALAGLGIDRGYIGYHILYQNALTKVFLEARKSLSLCRPVNIAVCIE